jgi:PAS domain S-box-containing protein
LFGGIWLGLFNTHSLFTPLVFGILGFLFAEFIRQPYRTTFFRWLGHPIVASIFLGIINIPLVILTALWGVPGSLAVVIEYSLVQSWPLFITQAAEFLVGGILCEIIFLSKSQIWFHPQRTKLSPVENNLQTRYLSRITPLFFILIFSLTIAGWKWASNTARAQLEKRIQDSAVIIANTIPYFLETGQNLIVRQAANPELIGLSSEELQVEFGKLIHQVVFFEDLGLVSGDSNSVTWYGDNTDLKLTKEEVFGVTLANKGVLVQTYTITPENDPGKVQISFIASIISDQHPVGALIGRADLLSNPVTKTAIALIQRLGTEGGMGAILDENRIILFHTTDGMQMKNFPTDLPMTGGVFESLSPQGQGMLMYNQPSEGRKWSVVVGLPTELIQDNALQLAVPQFLLALGLTLLVVGGIFITLRTITKGLRSAAQTAMAISQGRLDIPLITQGDDEIGQLGQAFETMRLGLKNRLEELNSLLVVSQGVASNLRTQNAVTPVLEAGLRVGASCIRIITVADADAEISISPHSVYGAGKNHENFSYLDEQIVELSRYQAVLPMANVNRTRRLTIPTGNMQPSSLIAIALNYEHTYYGTMWVAFDDFHPFTDDEIRYLTTLAGQAALAVANSRLFTSAEVGRQRLEAVLNSAPEPIMVFDEQMNLLLLNPAALQVPELVATAAPGKPVNQVLPNAELQKLVLRPIQGGITTGEVAFSNKRIYFVSVSQVSGEGMVMGRVCILRDITYYKNLDREKSDYVSNVSHDLRSPLTLLRGYVTMIQMMGELNDQQQGFIKKMVLSVDNMTAVVEKLLDLGRLESGVGLVIGKVMPVLIIDEVVVAQSGDAAKKNIQIDTSNVPRHRIEMEADPALLSQALRNLLENALKYTSMGGKVSIGLKELEDSIVFEMRDTGIGIAPLDLPRVFEKFYRSSRREAYAQKGSGLGLAIVKSIVERHNGRIWVESQLGKGSVFFIQMPLKQPRNPNH